MNFSKKNIRTRLTREESSRCKLTDDDIDSFFRYREEGMSYANIAKIFNVSMPTVWLYCNPDKKYLYNKKQWEKRKEEGYYDKNGMREKLRKASKNTTNKKCKIIPGYAEYIYKQAYIRKASKFLEDSIDD